MKFLLLLVLELIAPVTMGLVTLVGRESSLLCPGEEVGYFCHTTQHVNTITWMILDPNNQDHPSTIATFSVGDGGRNETLSYSTGDGGLVSLNLAFSYTSIDAETWSNVSVSVLDANYSIGSLIKLKIGCEERMNYRQLDLTGSPLPPTSLGYNFTNCNTTISWLLPPTGSRDHHPTDGLTLRYALIPAARYEESVLMELANDRTNVTVSLLCNMVYDVTLFATSCRGSLKSENISINMTSPECPVFPTNHLVTIDGPETTTLSPATISSGSSQTLSTVIVIIVAAFLIGLLLIIIVALICCVIKFRAAKTNATIPLDFAEGIDSTNTEVSMDECSAANFPMDNNLAYGIHSDMVFSTHFLQQRQDSGGQNILGDSPGHAATTEEGRKSPEHVYATIEEELNITHTSQPTTGQNYDP